MNLPMSVGEQVRCVKFFLFRKTMWIYCHGGGSADLQFETLYRQNSK